MGMILVMPCVGSALVLQRRCRSLLTEMEVVVLSIADDGEDGDGVNQGWGSELVFFILRPLHQTVIIRIGEGLLPKYLARYQAVNPRGFGSGAGPRGRPS